jgi:hypothetical protein
MKPDLLQEKSLGSSCESQISREISFDLQDATFVASFKISYSLA